MIMTLTANDSFSQKRKKNDKIFKVENSRLEIIKTTTTTELFFHPKVK